MLRTKVFSLLFGLLSCLCMTNLAKAQENWRLGLEVTPSYFMMYNKTDWNSTFTYPVHQSIFNIKGLAVGGRLSVDLNEYISLVSGLRYVYSRQDYKQFGDGAYLHYENYFTSKELQLPILFSVGTSNRDDVRFYCSLGLGLNYRISYGEKLAFSWQDPFNFEIYSGYELFEGNTYSYFTTGGEGAEGEIVVDKMYKDFTLTALFETGITRTFSNGFGVNLAFQYQCGISNPENREAQFYDIPEDLAPIYLWHTPDGTKWWTQEVEEDIRPQTFPMYFGILFGIYYQFGYR